MQVGGGLKRLIILAVGLVVLVGAAAGIYWQFFGTKAGDPAAQATADPAEGSADASVAQASSQAASGSGDDEKGNGEKKTAVPVNVTAVVTGRLSSYITSTANLVSENEVRVLTEAEGRIAELLVEEGDRVAKGQVLATLVRDDAEIVLRKAELKEHNARLAHERGSKVIAEELLSREAFDKLTMDKEIAEQELAEAKWRLEKTTIRAPFAGKITQRIVKLGQHVRPPEHLFTVADFDPLIALIYLPERDVIGLDHGRDVRITLKADEGTQLQGRVRQISPVVDTATGTVKVTIEAVAPPAAVRSGAFVTIDIVRETRAQAVLVPRNAVIRELQDAYVFVAKGDLAEKRELTLGLEEGGSIEVLTGVQAGDQVIVAGQGGLKNGSLIKIVPSTEASGLGIGKDRDIRG